MAADDAAFMWETEAIRSSGVPGRHRRVMSSDPGEGWLTLRETVSATGIPISTLRKWVRKDSVPSFIHVTADGPIRMLWLEGVQERAEELGRELEASPSAVGPARRSAKADIEIDLDAEPSSPSPVQEPESPPEPAPVPEPAPGTMVVPIEAWDKMLMQLGNLHEAGQQLAEARERAGKAETEARFLRERLAELRADKGAASPGFAVEPTPEVEPTHSRRVSIEVEDGSEERMTEVSGPVEEDVVVEEDAAQRVTNLSNYSIAVVKHLFGTWRDRPRR